MGGPTPPTVIDGLGQYYFQPIIHIWLAPLHPSPCSLLALQGLSRAGNLTATLSFILKRKDMKISKIVLVSCDFSWAYQWPHFSCCSIMAGGICWWRGCGYTRLWTWIPHQLHQAVANAEESVSHLQNNCLSSMIENLYPLSLKEQTPAI